MPTLTITTNAVQAQRIAAAFGELHNLLDVNGIRRDATATEVKAELIKYLKATVLNYETAQARKAIVATPMEPT